MFLESFKQCINDLKQIEEEYTNNDIAEFVLTAIMDNNKEVTANNIEITDYESYTIESIDEELKQLKMLHFIRTMTQDGVGGVADTFKNIYSLADYKKTNKIC